MKNKNHLISATEDFFYLHWPSAWKSLKAPVWLNWDSFLLGSVPNHKLGGCYALFENENLIYIGKGVGNISRRLTNHVLRIKGYTEVKGVHLSKLLEKWENVTAIYTIGFEPETEYLAHSLENYLIRRLTPRENKQQ